MPQYPSGRPFDLARALFDIEARVASLELNRSGSTLVDGGADGSNIDNPIIGTSPSGDESSGQLIYSSQVQPLNSNGDFEDANGFEPWGGLKGGLLAVTGTGVLHGSGALAMQPDGITANPGMGSELFGVVGSSQYSLSLWTFSPVGWSTTQIGVAWYDATQQPISTSLTSTYALTGGTGIMKVLTVTSPSNAAYGQIVAQLTGTPSSGVQLIIDTAWIVPGSVAPALTLSSSITGVTGNDQYGAGFPAGAMLTQGNVLGGILATGSVDATKVSFTAAGIGGITTSVQSSAPTSPHTGDLWFDSSNGNVLKQWNGSAWVIFQYGTQAIAAASVTAALIVAGTITAAQIAAGTILGSNIAAGTLTSDLITSSAIVAGLIDTGALNGMTINAITINGGTISAADLLVSGDQGGLFVYGSGGQIVQTITSGTSWKCPQNVTSIMIEGWAPGGGGGSSTTAGGGGGGTGGGGGEYAQEPAMAVTPGNTYAYSLGSVGTGSLGNPGTDATNLTFTGNSVTLTAHGGHGGGIATSVGGLKGTGSSNTIHKDGGNGGGQTSAQHGMGGGSSGGSTGNGRSVGQDVRSGASPVSGGGGGPGGDGGGSSNPDAGSIPDQTPGGGGGGGGTDGTHTRTGASGGKGVIVITYTPSTVNLVGSITGSTGVLDPVGGASVPEGLSIDFAAINKALTATGGTVSVPTLITTDSWHDTGAMASGWSKTGYFKYTLLPNGWVGVAAKLTPDGTATNKPDGSTILSAANGLPSAYRPATNKLVAAYVDIQRLDSVHTTNSNGIGLSFITDGSVQCFGIAATATSCIVHAAFPIVF
jgi:hypothetical protein